MPRPPLSGFWSPLGVSSGFTYGQIIIANDSAATTDVDNAIVIDVLANDMAPPNSTLSIFSITQGAHGVVTIEPGNLVKYTPQSGYEGPDQFSYTITDGQGSLASAFVYITVGTPQTNQPPIAVGDTATVVESQSVIINVLANDTDADGDALTVTIVSAPTHGSAVVNGDNTITFTADSYVGEVQLTYQIDDGQATDTATVTITVTAAAANQPPVVVDGNFTSLEGAQLQGNVLVGAYDPEGGAVTAVPATGATAQGGTFEVFSNGLFTYDPPTPTYTGLDQFSFTAQDAQGATTVGTIYITVEVEGAASAVDDRIATYMGATRYGRDVMRNDFNPDSLTLATFPGTFATNEGGEVWMTSDGKFSYMPPPSYSGKQSDYFDYTLFYGAGTPFWVSPYSLPVEPTYSKVVYVDSMIGSNTTKYNINTRAIDNQNGTETAYPTIGAAVAALTAGTQILVRGGTYRESVTLPYPSQLATTPSTPVGLRGYQDELPTLSGAMQVTGFTPATQVSAGNNPNWQNIYQAKIPGALMDGSYLPLMFEDGESLFPASYPLQPIANVENEKLFFPMDVASHGRTDGFTAPSLTEPDGYWDGAWVRIWLHGEGSSPPVANFVREYKVASYANGEVILESALPQGLVVAGPNVDAFAFVNSLDAKVLSQPGQFVIDRTPDGSGDYDVWVWPFDPINIDAIEVASKETGIKFMPDNFRLSNMEVRGFSGLTARAGGIVVPSGLGASNVLVHDMRVNNCYAPNSGAIDIQSCTDIVVYHNLVQNTGHGTRGLRLSSCTRGRAVENDVSITGLTALSMYGCTNSVADRNRVHGFIGTHANCYTFTNGNDGILFLNNISYNTTRLCFTAAAPSNNINIIGNMFDGNGVHGMMQFRAGIGGTCNILQNAIIRTADTNDALQIYNPPAGAQYNIGNNIFQGCNHTLVHAQINAGYNFWTGLSYVQVSPWVPGTGDQLVDLNDIYSVMDGERYIVKPTSPTIDTGTDLSSLDGLTVNGVVAKTDLRGRTRPSGPYDVGPVEYFGDETATSTGRVRIKLQQRYTGVWPVNPDPPLPDVAPSGVVRSVGTDLEFRAALIACKPGDTIELQTGYNAGSTRVKSGSTGDPNYASTGVGTALAQAGQFPKINAFAGEWVRITSQDPNQPSNISKLEINDGDDYGYLGGFRFDNLTFFVNGNNGGIRLQAPYCTMRFCKVASDGGDGSWRTWGISTWNSRSPQARAITLSSIGCEVQFCNISGQWEGISVDSNATYCKVMNNRLDGISGDFISEKGNWNIIARNVATNSCYDETNNHPDFYQHRDNTVQTFGNVIQDNDFICFDDNHPAAAQGKLPTKDILPFNASSTYVAGDYVYHTNGSDARALWYAKASGGEVLAPNLDNPDPALAQYWVRPDTWTIPALPQGIFSGGSYPSGFLIENNLVRTQTYRGISFVRQQKRHAALSNAALNIFSFAMQAPNNYHQSGQATATTDTWLSFFGISEGNIGDTFPNGKGPDDLLIKYAAQADAFINPYHYETDVSNRVSHKSEADFAVGFGPDRLQRFTPADFGNPDMWLDPNNDATLELWYDFSDMSSLTLNGSKIVGVADKSGNGRNLTALLTSAPSVGPDPASGRNAAILADGEFLESSGTFSIPQPLNFMAVVRVDGTGIKTILDSKTSGGITINHASGRFEIDAGSTAIVGYDPDNTTRGVNVVLDGASSTAAVNAMPTSAVDVGSNPLTQFYLGRDSSGGHTWAGAICEIIVWSGSTTDAQWKLIRDYQTHRWSLGAEAPPVTASGPTLVDVAVTKWANAQLTGTATLPAYSAGDRLLMIGFNDVGAAGTMTATGWAAVNAVASSSGVAGTKTSALTKIAVPGESAPTVTFDGTPAATSIAIISVDNAGAIEDSKTASSSSTNPATFDAPPVTLVTDNAMIIYTMSTKHPGDVMTGPHSNIIVGADRWVGATASIFVGNFEKANAGATSAQTVTFNYDSGGGTITGGYRPTAITIAIGKA